MHGEGGGLSMAFYGTHMMKRVRGTYVCSCEKLFHHQISLFFPVLFTCE